MTNFPPVSRNIDSRDDHFSWHWVESVLLAIVLAFLAGMLSGCMNDDDSVPADPLLVALSWEEWEVTPGINQLRSLGHCENLVDFRVDVADDEVDYLGYCPPKSAACQIWRMVPSHKVRADFRPVAVVMPGLSAKELRGVVVHEYMHALQECANYSIDYGHTNPLIWEGAGRQASVQYRVRTRLEAAQP